MGTSPLERIQADFDRIARLVAEQPERPDPYDAFLLSLIPTASERVLEIGCGAGRLARAVASRGAAVTAIDASPEMIRLARDRAVGIPRIRLVCHDFMAYPMDAGVFDAVLAVATLHHLDPAMGLARMKAFVRPGGVLVIHDLRSASGLADWLRSGLAATANGDAWRWIHHRLRESRELRAAWLDHGAGEKYLTMEEAQKLCGRHLPGATMYRHPLWRYTAVWARPVAS